MGKFDRTVAKYVFVDEIKNSNLDKEVQLEDSEYVSTHIITPTGQDITRVFICGTLIETEDIGADSPYFRARLVDPTGSINIYAGDYQPEAVKTISTIEPPAYIAVVGKVSLFETPDGTKIPTIRAENIAVIDKDTVRSWTFMAARNWITHHEDDKIAVEAKKTAMEHYGNVSEKYRNMVIQALESITESKSSQDDNPETEV